MTTNEAAERLDFHFRLECEGIDAEGIEAATRDIALALAAERRAFGKRVLTNFSDRVDRAWGNENAAKATDLLRWAVDEEAAR